MFIPWNAYYRNLNKFMGANTFRGIFGNASDIPGGSAPSIAQTSGDTFGAYLQYLPQINKMLSDQSVASAQQQTPALNALQLQQLQQYGVPLAQAGNAINTENVRATAALDKEVNPTLYQAKARAGDLMSSINLKGLSEGEMAAVERSLGKSAVATGNLGLDNATNAVTNAMAYGDRMMQKRQELNQYVNTGLGTGQVGVTGTGQSNFGLSQFQNPNAATQGTQNIGNNLLGSTTQIGTATINPAAEASYRNSDRYALDQIGANA